jgi:hypothetical protein
LGVKLWLPNDAQPDTNLAVFQVIARAPAEYDLTFVTRPQDSSAEARLAALQGEWGSGHGLGTAAAEHVMTR